MTLLRVQVVVPPGVEPDDPTVLRDAESAAAQKATAFTELTLEAVHDQGPGDSDRLPDGYRLAVYITDAVPRTTVTTTANIAPHLLPPRQ